MYFFFLKILNVFQKKDKKSMLITDFFFFFVFPSEDFKSGNIHKKSFKDVFLIHNGRRRKNELRMDTIEHTASTILVVVTKNFKKKTFYSILELWLFTSHMDNCGCSFLLFYFCSHIKLGGVCKCASAIRTLSGG